MTTLFEFKECRLCHCKETVGQKACANEPTLNKGAFIAQETAFTPTQDISKISTPMVHGFMSFFDICAECGFKRCIRVDEASIPAEMLGLKTIIKKAR